MSASERARQGDGGEQAAAVAEAFRTHAGLVERVLRRAGVAERDLSDARQEVFIVVHRRLCEFEGRSSLGTWLYRIALHVASDHRRRAYQRREQLAGSESTAAALALAEPRAAGEGDRDGGGARDPVHGLEQRELLEHALRALDQLDPDKREAFVLAELYELPMREVAARLGCPQKTAFSRTYAARRRILAELHKHGSLPILPLFFPLRALRGLELQAGGCAPFAPIGALVQLTGGSALIAAAVLLAVLANRVPAAPIAPAAARASLAQAQAVAAPARASVAPEAVRERVPERRVAPARASFLVEPVRVRRPTRTAPRARDESVAEPIAPAPELATAVPAVPAAAAADDELRVVRSGAVDLRPGLVSPLADVASAPADAVSAPPGRIRLRGPSDAADAVERALDADPVFARPIALQ
ncbi:MAG TPA: sigma-70 family RNA polymerase sigma factor [Polyangiales bacterium]|nr:sigma-70 family RNA polymerase sigma factor [Polyangiales bacterium]